MVKAVTLLILLFLNSAVFSESTYKEKILSVFNNKFISINEGNNKYCFKGKTNKLKVVKNIGGCKSISDIHLTNKGSLCIESDDISCNKIKISIDGKYSWGRRSNSINIHSKLDGLSSFDTLSVDIILDEQEEISVEDTGVAVFDNNSNLGKEYLRKAWESLKKKDKYNAYKWVKKSAELNYPDGLFGMGKAYQTGELSVEKNKKKALKWYLKAAKLGHTESQNMVGQLSDDGAESEKWHLKAADKGHVGSQANLGYMYAKGTGSSIWGNKKLGHKYFLMAAEQGNETAQRNVCLNFWKGWVLKKIRKKL